MFVAGFGACAVFVAIYFWMGGVLRRLRARSSHAHFLLLMAEGHVHRMMEAPNEFMFKHGDHYYTEYERLSGTVRDLGAALGFLKRRYDDEKKQLDDMRCSACNEAMFRDGQLLKPFCATIPTRRRMVDDMPEAGIAVPGGRIISMYEYATVCSRACANKVIDTWLYLPEALGGLDLSVLPPNMRRAWEENRYGERDALVLVNGHCNLAKVLSGQG